MKYDDLTLISAYLDNELSPEERQKVEHRLANETEFATMFADFDAINSGIQTTYAEIDQQPIPAAIESLLSDAEQVTEKVQESTVEENVTDIRSKFSVKRFLPLAASVATVALALPLILHSDDDLQSRIADALNTIPSGQVVQLNDESSFRVSMSFIDNNENLCREYQLSSNQETTTAQQIIACNISDQWQEMVAIDIQITTQGEFRPASGPSNQALESWLDNNMGSDVLSLTQEQQWLSKFN